MRDEPWMMNTPPTWRDKVAAMALQGLMANPMLGGRCWSPEVMAAKAYACADALEKVRRGELDVEKLLALQVRSGA